MKTEKKKWKKEKIMNSFPTWELHFLVQFDEKNLTFSHKKRCQKRFFCANRAREAADSIRIPSM